MISSTAAVTVYMGKSVQGLVTVMQLLGWKIFFSFLKLMSIRREHWKPWLLSDKWLFRFISYIKAIIAIIVCIVIQHLESSESSRTHKR